MNKMMLYHGSSRLVRLPRYGVGNLHNDYGLGFYTTEHPELAKEWACTKEQDGFVNRYELDFSNLSVLYLTRGEYHILNWLAILLENRVFRVNSDLARIAKDYVMSEFMPEYRSYDVICGYRADDSYFSFANLFLSNGITLDQLQQAMLLGNLGEQYVLKSQEAFTKIQFTGYEMADRQEYYPKKLQRDLTARETFQKKKAVIGTGSYIVDILRERWKNNDERIQRIISG